MYWEKQSIISLKKAAKIFQNIEKFIDIGKCTKTISLLKTLRLRYLQKVQRICSEFLADMPSDLQYILCCDWNFPPQVNIWWATYGVRTCETTSSLAALWLGTKKQKFCGTNQKPELLWPFGTGPLRPCPQGLLLPFLTFLSPNFFPARLDFFPPPLTVPGSPRMTRT